MILSTTRLDLICLSPEELFLWVHDLQALERRLLCRYDAEEMTGEFQTVVEGQIAPCQHDPGMDHFHSFFWIRRREDGVIVGSLDFKDRPNAAGEVEIGYGLGARYRKQGYMTEAVQALCAFGFSQDGVRAIVAETLPDNEKSQNVLLRCGFQITDRDVTVFFRKEKP